MPCRYTQGMTMKAWFPLLILLAGCASKPPPVAFLYKGMKKDVMLQIMGEPIQVVSTNQGEGAHPTEAKQYQFSNSKCLGETKNVCTVSVTNGGVVYGWRDIKPAYTEDGQR